jgi:hypothetical protein
MRENGQGGITIKAIIGLGWQSDQFIVVMKAFERRRERRDWQ